jgi:hypothetical protein
LQAPSGWHAAAHFASTMQPPSIMPPSQQTISTAPLHAPSQRTAWPDDGLHSASQLPVQTPAHFALLLGAPSHMPVQLPVHAPP